MSRRWKCFIALVILLSRIGFIFFDLVRFEKEPSILVTQLDESKQEFQHFSAGQNMEKMNEDIVLSSDTWGVLSASITDKQIDLIEDNESDNVFENLDIEKISLDTLSSKISNRLDVLDAIYQKTKDSNVLKVLLSDLLADYQFNKIKSYLEDVDILNSDVIDKSDYFYVYINTLSVTDPNSMTNFLKYIDELKQKNLVSNDEYLFYKWLQKIWDWDYDVALEVMKQISNTSYSSFVNQLETTITNFKNQKWMPKYYEDALISLMMLKKWYFSIANKLAVYTILEDDDYILPYQILAYSNFLLKDWDKSISYFYDLSSLDLEWKDKYDFYLWLSYYWKWDYANSLTTLYQLANNPVYKMDVYRYMLLNYEKLWQFEKMAQIWQKMLWEYSLQESDFKYFYDTVFFWPFSHWQTSEIYENYRQMSYDVVVACYEKFGVKNDTCIYWEVWFNIVNWLWTYEEEHLLYLAENYPQASLYQALGDYYKKNNQKSLAKQYYLKSISMTDDSVQETLLRSLLSDVIN